MVAMFSRYSPSRSRSRAGIRVVSVLGALIVMAVYMLFLKQAKSPHLYTETNNHRMAVKNLYALPQVPIQTVELGPESLQTHMSMHDAIASRRHLLSLDDNESVYFVTSSPPPLGDDDDGDNCTAPRGDHVGYNDSCAFVLDQCQDEVSLINYLAFTLCDMANVLVGTMCVGGHRYPSILYEYLSILPEYHSV